MTPNAPNSRNWSLLHARIHQTLKQQQLLPKQHNLLVAVSGGQDSLCLLQLLLDLQPHWNWQLAVAHCNHRWRSDSDANAAYIVQLANQRRLPYYSATATGGIATEAAAREWRYQALTSLAIEQGYSHVVTGHTASDRAETLLYNLIRGSGTDGLQALSWQRPLDPNVQLVRPLLDVTRTETAAFCQQFKLQIWQDSTNHNLQYARNRIRQELLPYLQTHFNPQVETALAQTAELLRADVAYLETVAASLEQHLIRQEANAIGLNRSQLQAEPLALQRRVTRRFLKQALPSAPTFDQIQKLLALLSAPSRSQTDPFPGEIIAQVDGEWIWLKKLPAQP